MKLAPMIFVFINTLYAYQEHIPPPPSDPAPPPGLPIDGFAVFLFVLGIIYGVKKRYDTLKSNASN